jgi:hypothetical protein
VTVVRRTPSICERNSWVRGHRYRCDPASAAAIGLSGIPWRGGRACRRLLNLCQKHFVVARDQISEGLTFLKRRVEMLCGNARSHERSLDDCPRKAPAAADPRHGSDPPSLPTVAVSIPCPSDITARSETIPSCGKIHMLNRFARLLQKRSYLRRGTLVRLYCGRDRWKADHDPNSTGPARRGGSFNVHHRCSELHNTPDNLPVPDSVPPDVRSQGRPVLMGAPPVDQINRATVANSDEHRRRIARKRFRAPDCKSRGPIQWDRATLQKSLIIRLAQKG